MAKREGAPTPRVKVVQSKPFVAGTLPAISFSDKRTIMQTGPSSLSLVAAVLYLVVAFSCMIASTSAVSRHNPLASIMPWVLIGLFFGAMAISRYFDIEDTLRNSMRGMLQADNAYEIRREYQRPMAAIVLVLGSALGFWLVYKIAKGVGSRRVLALRSAKMATICLFTLVMLRIVSLHPVDGLLYGPLKLNWFIDVGASLAVLAAAFAYIGSGPKNSKSSRA